MAAGSDELARASQTIAESATTQAASVQELVATSNQVAEQVQENAEGARLSAKETEKVMQMMENSKVQMNQMMTAMDTITTTSNQVVGIIQTIEEIASQTNLLALNNALGLLGPSPKEAQRIREYTFTVLDYWKKERYIKGYKAIKEGKTYTAVEIQL